MGFEERYIAPEANVRLVEPNGEEIALEKAEPNLESAQKLMGILSGLPSDELVPYVPEIKSKIEALQSAVSSPEIDIAIGYLEVFLREAENSRE